MKARHRKLQLQRRFRSVHGHWLCPCNAFTGARGTRPGRAGFAPVAALLALPMNTLVLLPQALAPGGLVGKS